MHSPDRMSNLNDLSSELLCKRTYISNKLLEFWESKRMHTFRMSRFEQTVFKIK